jgi:hypothetical protein
MRETMGTYGVSLQQDFYNYIHKKQRTQSMTLNFPQVTPWIPKLPTVLLILALCLLTAFTVKQCTATPRQTYSPPQLALETPQVINETKQEVPLATPKKTIKVYKDSIKSSLSLPKAAVHNANIKLTDSSVIKGSERDTQVNQTLDITTGETTTYTTQLSSPWFAVESKGAASVDYGFKRGSTQAVGRLNVRQNLVQVKDIHLGISGSVYTDGDYFVGVGGEYRW